MCAVTVVNLCYRDWERGLHLSTAVELLHVKKKICACKKKYMCVCSTNLGFSMYQIRMIPGTRYVLCTRYVCTTLYDTRYVLCTRYVCTTLAVVLLIVQLYRYLLSVSGWWYA